MVFTCEICKCAYFKESALENHKEKDHKIIRTNTCSKCDYFTKNYRTYKEHPKTCIEKVLKLSNNLNQNQNNQQTLVRSEINEPMDYDGGTCDDDNDELSRDFYNEIINKTQYCEESVELKLKKKLAKIILDTKYEYKVTQTCIDRLVYRFKNFFNEGIEIFSVSYKYFLPSHKFKTFSSNLYTFAIKF